MPKSRILPRADGAGLPALDPATLGRPFHLLPAFLRLLEQELSDFVAHELNGRYRARFRLQSLKAGTVEEGTGAGSWHPLDEGHVGVRVERPLLLSVLEYRYGGRAAAGSARLAPQTQHETETERRLARLLGERIAPHVRRAVWRLAGDGLPAGGAAEAPATLPFPPCEAPAWTLALTLGEAGGGASRIALAFDAPAFAAVLRLLARRRAHAEPRPAPATAFSERLKVALCARLVEKRMTLGDIVDLKVGTVLPVGLKPRADVRIGPRRVFSANVAERHGRLCLTSFDDAE
ncbi:flagellar motor switch protein FliM [Crenobacter luteus]|uniref:Flagellar motor switch protein FliM n=1 Tax=Crenobacter luteus TaxID=1452487 RepID=A0A161S9H1_9NEIS|nr:FliM/FliN family flagellar motor C-terminal domain-containing protein [Crenobacter luteus]KZE31733.1 flagellar motor switch protein FliM [Crenobacter luteus]TCP15597.1 flagellar motor switch protein FliM [Crenobacter luteus]